MTRDRSGDFPRGVVGRFNTQAFGKGNIRSKVERPKESIKIPLTREFALLLSRFDRYPPGEFSTTAVEPDKENPSSMRLDSLNDVLDEFIIVSLSIDEGEDRVNLFLGCFFEHLSPIFVH